VQLALAIRQAKRIYLCGNGGSAANAIHIANDLIACGVKAFALPADVATLTAIANDFSYDEVFSRQLKTLAEKDDLLIVLSGSGRSKNILSALTEARRIGMKSWAILGNYEPRGPAAGMADQKILKGSNMQLAEEYQLSTGHEVMRWLKRNS